MTPRWRSGGAGRSRCAGACRSRPATWPRSTPTPSPGSGARRRPDLRDRRRAARPAAVAGGLPAAARGGRVVRRNWSPGKRAATVTTAGGGPCGARSSSRLQVEALFRGHCRPGRTGPGGRDRRSGRRGRRAWSGATSTRSGPVTAAQLAERHRARPTARSTSPWPGWSTRASPCGAGSIPSWTASSGAPGGCWPASTSTPRSGCGRRSSRSRPRTYMRFLLRWQHVAPGTHRHGRYRPGVGHRAAAGVRVAGRHVGGPGPACPT